MDSIQPTIDCDVILRPQFMHSLAVATESSFIPIEIFAAERHLDRDLVWSQIQAGRLRARVKNGKVFIVTTADEQMDVVEPTMEVQSVQATESVTLKSLFEQMAGARQEQIELARLTRTTIEHIRSMSQELSFLKDRLLHEKDSRIEALEADSIKQHQEIIKLHKIREDLESLTAAIE